MALVPVPEEVSHVASLALTTRAERGSGGTARGLVIATALTTGFITEHELTELRAWHAAHPEAVQNGSSTLLAGLYGGSLARSTWEPVPEPVTASASPLRARLAKLSTTVKRTDRQTLTKLHAAANLALTEAMNAAGAKVQMKSQDRRLSKAAKDVVAASQGKLTAPVLAAVGLTEHDLLNKRFDTFSATAVALLAAAERRKLAAAAKALGISRDEVEAEYGPTIDQRAAAAGAAMGTALGLLARDALSGHGLAPETAQGEFSGPVPFGVIRSAYAIADRGAAAPVIDETGSGPSAVDELGQAIVGAGQTLIQELFKDVGEQVQVRSTWSVGDPDRPFEPHQDLDGLSWVDTQPPELDWDSGEFPYVNVLQPGDHSGCQCLIAEDYEPYEGDAGEGVPVETPA